MSTPTFEPDVFVDVTREQYLAWLEAGKPVDGPHALPAGAIPITAAGLNRLGQALQVASEVAGAAATADALSSAQAVLQAGINARTTTAQAQAIAQAAIAAFVGSAPAELDTWPEVVAYLASLSQADSGLAGQITTLTQQIAAKYTKPAGGIPAGDLAAGVIPDTSTLLTKTDAAATYQQAVMVDAFKLAGDTNDAPAWTRAIAAAKTSGKRLILAQSPSYTCTSPVDLAGLNNVVIAGLGMHATVVTFNGGASAMNGGFYNTGSLSGLTIRDMTIKGTVDDDIVIGSPRRSHTNTGGAGVNSGLLLRADRPGLTGFGVVKDVRLLRAKFDSNNELPFVFDGVTGYAAAYDVECYNSKDGSWLFCEHVVFDSLRSLKSHDNGFSISRSNKKVTGGSIHVDTCFDYGVFASGFYVDGNANDAGPTHMVIDSINVTYAGQGGVKLDDGPQGVVVNSVYVNTVPRGGIDIPTDSGGIGILIGGNPATPTRAATPTVFASGIMVNSAVLINCRRGGILISGGARDISLSNLLILDAGSQYLADGTTAIGTGDRNNNFGVAVAQSFEGSVSNVIVRGVRVVDRRTTPYTNRAIDLAGAATSSYSGLSQAGCRVSVPSDTSDEIISGTKTFRARPITQAPTVGVFPGGSTADAASAAGNGANDFAGTVNVTAKASPAAGVLCTVTYGKTDYTAVPHVVITPTNAASAAVGAYLSSRSATGFQISCINAPAASAALQWDYHVLQ